MSGKLLEFGILRERVLSWAVSEYNLEPVAGQLTRYRMCLGKSGANIHELLGLEGIPRRMRLG